MTDAPQNDPPIVDGHLDLAENVTIFGRDLSKDVTERRVREARKNNQATVSLPDLQRGGVAVVFATVTPGFLVDDVGEDFEPRAGIYHSPGEAEAQAVSQIALYERWEAEGRVRLVKSVNDLEHHLKLWKEDRIPGLVMLMEGADPIVRVSDLPRWWRRGLRIISLTFGDTRYGHGVAGGSPTFKRGGLTEAGFALLDVMAEQGFAWDLSHLTEDGIREGLDRDFPRVCVSHANVRALTPTDRHLNDEVIRTVAARDGVIGLTLYNKFLEPQWNENPSVAVTLGDQFRRHAEHIAAVGGWRCVGIGSDLDGGFGLEESPQEIDTIADLSKTVAVIPEEAREMVLSTNWLGFLRRSLPRTA